MEVTFSELRAKEVINTQDGRKLGRVCDVALCYPENRWVGIIVPNGRGWGKRNDLFIEMKNIVKVGEDVILVNIGMPRKQGDCKRGAPPPKGNPNGFPENRNYDEYE